VKSDVLRILDANANRAREALRVIEDYARFSLDDAELSAALKQLRHDFASATADLVAAAILHRDTPGDVGTATKTPSEQTREDLAHVVTAAGKRLGEALRTIEEYLKTTDASRAAQIESIRYRFYDIEQKVAFTLRPVACLFADVRLYVLVTESLCKRPWLSVVQNAIEGGADCIQLREKAFESGELLSRARELVRICRPRNVLTIINDRPDIAVLADADGVHVGQADLPAREVRRLMGTRKILGVSTHQIEHAKQAVRDGADYIGVGPFFKSTTKTRDFVAGADYARQVVAQCPIPGVAIAGINEQNVDEVLATGIRAVAVSSAVCVADDPREAAQRLKAKLSARHGCLTRQ
jgi:thiamine-phosphate pyrophosphorylase